MANDIQEFVILTNYKDGDSLPVVDNKIKPCSVNTMEFPHLHIAIGQERFIDFIHRNDGRFGLSSVLDMLRPMFCLFWTRGGIEPFTEVRPLPAVSQRWSAHRYRRSMIHLHLFFLLLI